MNGRSRQPGGRAWGALAGTYPDPAPGLPSSVGVMILDEFVRNFSLTASFGQAYGELPWGIGPFGSSATVSYPNPTAATEIGLHRLTTAAVSGSGAVLIGGNTQTHVTPVAGLIWATKIKMTTGTSSYELWSGLGAYSRVATADATTFLGVRSIGGNLFGVAKTGAAAETTVDLGIDCESAWRTVGFEYTDDGVQFFTLSTDRYALERTDVGSPVTTNIPTGAQSLLGLGVVTTTASARAADIDWWNLGGRIAR